MAANKLLANTLEEVKRVPLWGWGVVAAGVVGVVIYLHNQAGASAASTTAGATDTTDTGGVLDSGQSAPSSTGTSTTGSTSTTPASSTSTAPTPTAATSSAPKKTYIVKAGDTLGDIGWAQHVSGGAQALYNANTGVIESTAKAHGFSSSDSGHWIFPGEVLVLP